MSERKDIWFPAKRYGVGWGLPVTWQGWSVFGGYLALVMVGVALLAIFKSPILIVPFIIYLLLLSGALIFVCFKKGEKLDFRWGKRG